MNQTFSKELFAEQIEKGLKYEKIVYNDLLDAGIPAEMEIYHGDKFTQYQQDIIIKPDFVIEVKSRNLVFTGPHDFPFEDAVIETVWGWNQKRVQPRAIVMISQITEAKIAINVQETKDRWTQRVQYDSLRGIESLEFFVDRKDLRPFDELKNWLKENYK